MESAVAGHRCHTAAKRHWSPSAVPWPYVRPTATACKESSPLALPAACGPGEIDPRRQCGADHGHRRHAPWECPELGNGRKETLRNRSIRKPRRQMSSFGFDSILNGSRAGWRGLGQIRLVGVEEIKNGSLPFVTSGIGEVSNFHSTSRGFVKLLFCCINKNVKFSPTSRFFCETELIKLCMFCLKLISPKP